MNYEDMIITGLEINYYFICKYKLWLFTHFISYEHDSELVKLGKIFHEIVSKNESRKEISFKSIKIDIVKKKKNFVEIHEIKKSDKAEKAHFYQLLYYLYYLNKYGILAIGYLKYPLQHRVIKVMLTNENEIEKILDEITKIKNSKIPPKKEKTKFCKNCAYYEFCWC